MLNRPTVLRLTTALVALSVSSCIDLNIPEGEGLFPEPSFIISGVMELDAEQQLCSRFRADNGLIYHLYQGPRLTNDEYDQLFQEGARARLEIEIRKDLELVPCRRGATVEVLEVLEFIPP